MELHVFDFDGTIFNSPSPSSRIKETHGPAVYSKLMRPLQDGGFGWFQSLTTLSPPAVPQQPSLEEWYVAPVIQRLRELEQRKKESAATGMPEMVKVCLLTGRDEAFRQRIEELLAHAGLRGMMTSVLLKPHQTYGTVRFKLEALYALIAEHRPEHVFYYEDREEQGLKLLAGIRLLTRVLHPGKPDDFVLNAVVLESDGELRPHTVNKGNSPGVGLDPCNAALRWWEETRKRAAPHPVSSIVPFYFKVLFIDPVLSSRSESILSAKEENALVSQLKYERDSYTRSNPPVSRPQRSALGSGRFRTR
ncbi:Swiss Army Knife RNA repair protein [Trypanosoma melophagium]|uniref:Swiss Army Knife RNA repair protein n=1 Tax=Trypanosoma melophagium TaxID=715481 RepID=UPI003519E918|nr:Swiss Army Knife RNA repair protein [Trypanosoma melophagium]